MVSQVGSITSATNNNSLTPLNPMDAISGNNTNVNSVFNYGNPLTSGTTYDNDMFMPAYLKTPVITGQAQAQVQPQAQAQNTQTDLTQQVPQSQQQVAQPQYDVANSQQQTVATQNPQFTGSELNGCLAEPQGDDVDYTKSGNPYKKASFGKKSGAVLGFLAPIASHLISGSKEWKQLFKTCPLLAIAGFGIGYLVDSCTESNRANAADAAAKQAKQSQILAQSPQQQISAVA